MVDTSVGCSVFVCEGSLKCTYNLNPVDQFARKTKV